MTPEERLAQRNKQAMFGYMWNKTGDKLIPLKSLEQEATAVVPATGQKRNELCACGSGRKSKKCMKIGKCEWYKKLRESKEQGVLPSEPNA